MIFKGDIQISLWDLGGQDEFHSLHDLVIWNTNVQGIVSSFFYFANLFTTKKNVKINWMNITLKSWMNWIIGLDLLPPIWNCQLNSHLI
jgi:hypothetical protein